MIYQLGDEYFVRSLQESDLDGPYISWFEDQEVCGYNSHGKFFKTRAHFRDYLEGLDREDQLVWAICHQTDGHIGNISLQLISFINRNADFGVLIGDKRHWGRGVAYEAGMKLIQHAFYKLNLERIYCATAATNTSMRNLARKMGMVEEGCRRSHLFLDGKWVDMIEFGILRHERVATASAA